MGIADMALSLGATVPTGVTVAPEHPAIELLEEAIRQLRLDHPRASMDYIADVMSTLEAAQEAIADRDDLMVNEFASVVRRTLQ